jgi:hypothetical protein
MGKGKAKPRKRSVPQDLSASSARSVKGGNTALTSRKAGGGQQDYMIVKLNEVLITGVAPGGSS